MADELVRKCGTMEVHRRLLSTNRRYQAARAEIESLAFQYERRRRVSERSGLVTIPVVVHVVFNTREQNLPSRQIQSQIDVLNADYQMRGAGIAKLVPAFQPLAADARIRTGDGGPLRQPDEGLHQDGLPRQGVLDRRGDEVLVARWA
jgi:hypothetical protein